MIVLIHFLLHNAVPIKGKLHEHIQFYADIGWGMENLNDHRQRRGFVDEEEEEKKEEQARNALNQTFLSFVK